MKEMKIIRGLILSAITAISMIAGDVQDMQGLKTGATPACCSKLVTGQVWQDGMAVPTSSTGSMSQTGTLTWSGGTTTQGTSGGSFSGAGYYFADSSTISGASVYGATSGSGTWTVPDGVNTLRVVIVGGGGDSNGGTGGAGSGYIKGMTLNVTPGQSFSWSVGIHAQQSCFNGVCALPGQNGATNKGGNGGSAGGCGSAWATLGGGGGGGLGGIGGNTIGSCSGGCSGAGCCSYPGATDGESTICPIMSAYSATGQGYSSVITGAITAISLSTNTSTLFPLPTAELNGGTGYGAGAGGGTVCTLMQGLTCKSTRAAQGSNGAIFVWTE